MNRLSAGLCISPQSGGPAARAWEAPLDEGCNCAWIVGSVQNGDWRGDNEGGPGGRGPCRAERVAARVARPGRWPQGLHAVRALRRPKRRRRLQADSGQLGQEAQDLYGYDATLREYHARCARGHLHLLSGREDQAARAVSRRRGGPFCLHLPQPASVVQIFAADA